MVSNQIFYYFFQLHARPEIQSSAIVSFLTVKDAIASVVCILQSAIPIARIEFLDKISMKMCNAYSKTEYDENPTLFLEFHGSISSVQEQIELVKDITIDNRGSRLKYATTEEDRNKLWRARHDMHWAIRNYKPDKIYHGTDICVPISKLPEAIEYCHKLFQILGVEGLLSLDIYILLV